MDSRWKNNRKPDLNFGFKLSVRGSSRFYIIYVQWHIQGGGLLCDRPSGLSMNFWIIIALFCTVFVSFILRLNCKIRVRRLLVTSCFLPVKILHQNVKMHPNLSFWGTNNGFLSGEGAQLPPPHTTPSIPTVRLGPSLLKF